MRPVYAACLVTFAFVFSGCGRNETSVRFALPEGFRGVFQISEDAQNGADLSRSNGMLLIVVPTNGQVIVKDWSFLTHWHSETAIFPNGKLISEADYDTNALALHGLFSEGHTNWILVGTEREARIAGSIEGKHMPLARQLGDDDVPHYGSPK